MTASPRRSPSSVRIDPRAAAAYGVAGVLPVGAIVVTGGLVLRVRHDGGIDEVGAPGHPHGGIAHDPTARPRTG
jgi:hypothetical protein